MGAVLPRGALFHRRNGPFGNYLTWNQIHAMALIWSTTIGEHPAWTARRLAKAVGMSYQRMLLALERLKKMKLIEWGRNVEGDSAWVMAAQGRQDFFDILHARIKFSQKRWKDGEFWTMPLKLVEKAIWSIAELKKAGWRDIQAREEVIHYSPYKIEAAFRRMDQCLFVRKRGAYVRTLIEKSKQWQDVKRVQQYTESTQRSREFCEQSKELILKESVKFKNPLVAARRIIRAVSCGPSTPKAIDTIMEEMWKAKRLPEFNKPEEIDKMFRYIGVA